jgi:pimeloyl-ACP methyl ester carboxylesterase
MKLRQNIGFCASADGTRIAVASCGAGAVILRAAHWLSHVDYDLDSPVWRPWVERLSARNRFVRYDPRGCGLSDRFVADLSLAAWHADLETVAASIPEPRFVLLGVSQGGALAMTYARKHPERVSHLLLMNAYGQGARTRATTDAERLEAERMVNFVRIGWAGPTPPIVNSSPTCSSPAALPSSIGGGAISSGRRQLPKWQRVCSMRCKALTCSIRQPSWTCRH